MTRLFSLGPWSISQSGTVIHDADGEPIADIITDTTTVGDVRANAKLVAAAPTMYDALQEIVEAAIVQEEPLKFICPPAFENAVRAAVAACRLARGEK